MKKTISRLSICLFLSGALASCTASQSDYTMVEGYDTETLENGYGLPVNSCRMFPLEASPECMLSNPSKVEVLDSQIVVLDNEKLHVFGMDGRFRNHIGRKGNGHNEYISLSTFCMDSERHVLLIDSYKGKMLKYAIDGKFLEALAMPEGTMANVQNATCIGHDSLFVSEYLYNTSHNLYSIIDLSAGTKTTVAETPLQTDNTMEYVGQHPFSLYNGKIRYVKPFDNVIHALDGQDEFAIATKQRLLAGDELAAIHDFSIMTYARNMADGVFCGFTDIFETDKYIILPCKDFEYIVMDKQQSTCKRYSYEAGVATGAIPLFNIVASGSDCLVGMLTPTHLLKLKEEATNEIVMDAVNGLDISDPLMANVVIVLYPIR